MKFADNLESSHGLKWKSLKVAHNEELDEALYTWFIQQRIAGPPISGPLLQEKAKHFHSERTCACGEREQRNLQSFDRIAWEI